MTSGHVTSSLNPVNLFLYKRETKKSPTLSHKAVVTLKGANIFKVYITFKVLYTHIINVISLFF